MNKIGRFFSIIGNSLLKVLSFFIGLFLALPNILLALLWLAVAALGVYVIYALCTT
jgi:hypothetical protein